LRALNDGGHDLNGGLLDSTLPEVEGRIEVVHGQCRQYATFPGPAKTDVRTAVAPTAPQIRVIECFSGPRHDLKGCELQRHRSIWSRGPGPKNSAYAKGRARNELHITRSPGHYRGERFARISRRDFGSQRDDSQLAILATIEVLQEHCADGSALVGDYRPSISSCIAAKASKISLLPGSDPKSATMSIESHPKNGPAFRYPAVLGAEYPA